MNKRFTCTFAIAPRRKRKMQLLLDIIQGKESIKNPPHKYREGNRMLFRLDAKARKRITKELLKEFKADLLENSSMFDNI